MEVLRSRIAYRAGLMESELVGITSDNT